jgi:hypothetical protein
MLPPAPIREGIDVDEGEEEHPDMYWKLRDADWESIA